MRNRSLLFMLPALAFMHSSCTKEEDTAPSDLADVCGIDGYRLKATFDGTETCFGNSLFGAQADLLTINGIALLGSTLTLQLSDVAVGAHPVSGEANHMLLTVLGSPYESTDATPGSLNITSHNESANRIKGDFSVQMVPPGGGELKSVTGAFDITYIE